jgi:hypothetical protein
MPLSLSRYDETRILTPAQLILNRNALLDVADLRPMLRGADLTDDRVHRGLGRDRFLSVEEDLAAVALVQVDPRVEPANRVPAAEDDLAGGGLEPDEREELALRRSSLLS